MFANVVFVEDREGLVRGADVVLAVQPPALEVVAAMKAGAILMSFIYAHKEPAAAATIATCAVKQRSSP